MAPAVWGARSNPTHRAHHRFPLLFACAAATSFRSRGGNPHALPDTGRYRIAAKPPNRRNSAAASVAPSRPCRKRQLSSFSETRRGPARQLDACELLTKEDLSQILNLNIERVESTGRSSHSTCRYYSSAAQQRASDLTAATTVRLTLTDLFIPSSCRIAVCHCEWPALRHGRPRLVRGRTIALVSQ